MERVFPRFYTGLELFRRDFLNQSNDPNIGSARGDSQSPGSSTLSDLGVNVSTSAAALLTTFVPAFGLAVKIARLSATIERSPELPSGFFNWIGVFLRLPDSHVLRHSSLDGYFFVRFLKVMSVVCLVGCVITWPILLPIHIAGGAGNKQLDAMSFSNVKNPQSYYAHTIVAWIFFGKGFKPRVRRLCSSKTDDSAKRSYLCKNRLTKVFGDSVKRVWITSDCSKLQKLVKKRDTLAYRLEGIETGYIKKAHAAHLKSSKGDIKDPESSMETSPIELEKGKESFPPAPNIERPMHRHRYVFGQKVDTIDWLRSQLKEVIPQVEELQQRHREGQVKPVSAVFIEFGTQMEAQIAFQTLSHHHPLQMTPRFIGISPDQYSWWQRIIRKFLIQGFIAVLVIFWSIPSAFVGSISNITYLTNLLPFLKFINDLPGIVKGAISGVLPTVALAILMSLAPIILRWCARQSGLPSTARVELFTQNAHFVFQVVQVFLVTTLTSAASAATSQIIKDPLSAKDLLAENLPKASNFYISYFLFQGLILRTGAVMQVVTFLVFKLLRVLFDRPPRNLSQRWASLTGLSWGTVFPVFTNMVVIAYRYNLLFVYDSTVDTKGLIYPRALKQVLTGIYLAEICLIGLFAIKGAIGPLILMGIFAIVTAVAHISLNDALSPLLSALPRTLDNEDDVEEEIIGTGSEGCSSSSINDPEKGIAQATVTHTELIGRRARLRKKFLKFTTWLLHPSTYADYASLRKKVRQDPGITYGQEVDDNAYYPPSVTSPTPLLWVPRDARGVSRQEVALTRTVIPITDEGAHLDEKNKVVWDKIGMKPPIWQEKIFY
ncbi:hypothetical protein CISG_06431 [Coccidioides immitis RMSCC 3703]|uniref:DUF221 family protein n=1 Tax=Coccidioides immitis RMSCC 3703 TaxID=454286 RepID=A0A0J8R3K4_COCIT|nr:hypothetical protein CISG_06431 [Coccidioides immitis RMSCC 3703]